MNHRRSGRVLRQGLEPRTRGLRVRFLLVCEVSAYTGGCHLLPVRARHCGSRCRVVPGTDGRYRGRRANHEQTRSRMISALIRRSAARSRHTPAVDRGARPRKDPGNCESHHGRQREANPLVAESQDLPEMHRAAEYGFCSLSKNQGLKKNISTIRYVTALVTDVAMTRSAAIPGLSAASCWTSVTEPMRGLRADSCLAALRLSTRSWLRQFTSWRWRRGPRLRTAVRPGQASPPHLAGA
jgi:hypothetical protein